MSMILKVSLFALLVVGMLSVASAQVRLVTGVFATGGGAFSNATYAAKGTAGQGVIGRSTGTTYAVSAGFWGFGGGITDVEGPTTGVIPLAYALWQNYPNPFNPSTTIRFSIVNSQFTILKVYDVLGREVAALVNEKKDPGVYKIEFDASNLPSGTYFYKITAGDFSQTRRSILLK